MDHNLPRTILDKLKLMFINIFNVSVFYNLSRKRFTARYLGLKKDNRGRCLPRDICKYIDVPTYVCIGVFFKPRYLASRLDVEQISLSL